jgi:hypothetical protein
MAMVVTGVIGISLDDGVCEPQGGSPSGGRTIVKLLTSPWGHSDKSLQWYS